VTVKNLLPQKKFVEFDTVCTVAGKTVTDGDAILMVPSKG
jgi:3-hydroxybutyryl-CoA dehydratase